jgi:alkylhydroperoxidase family enzyme
MARIPYPERDDLPAEYRHLLETDRNISRVLANSPELAKRARALASYFQTDSRLDARLREMAIIQVGYVSRSAYEYTHHIKIGLKVGVSQEDIRAIAEETAGRPTELDPLAKAVLRAAREMTLELTVTESTFAELSAALNPGELVDLIYGIGIYNAVVRILASLEVDLEDGYDVYLHRFPFAAA